MTAINITIDLDWIIEVDTATGSWIGIIWFGLSWYDHRLSWNKTDYNVSKITVPGSQIWVPDFRDIELAGDSETQIDIRKEMFVVHNDGLIIGQVRRKHKSYCIIQPKYYPYDTGHSKFSLRSNASQLSVERIDLILDRHVCVFTINHRNINHVVNVTILTFGWLTNSMQNEWNVLGQVMSPLMRHAEGW